MFLYNSDDSTTFDLTQFDVFGLTVVNDMFCMYLLKRLYKDPADDPISSVVQFKNEKEAKERYIDILDAYAHGRCVLYDINESFEKRNDKGIL